MWTNKKALILSTILQLAPFAHADNGVPGSPPGAQIPEPAGRPASRIDYFSNRLFALRTKASSDEPIDRVRSSASISRTTTLPENTPNGLHWAPDEQRSALEYKFSEQNTMRVRMGHHGGELQGLWRF